MILSMFLVFSGYTAFVFFVPSGAFDERLLSGSIGVRIWTTIIFLSYVLLACWLTLGWTDCLSDGLDRVVTDVEVILSSLQIKYQVDNLSYAFFSMGKKVKARFF